MEFQCKINNVEVQADVPPRLLLSDFVRHELRLTGTHVGCEMGVCGACTVMLNGEAVRSCLIFAAQVDGCSVRTVEGLAPDGVMRDIHHAFLEHQGLQCGFCTPGILMTVAAAMEAGPLPQAEAGIRDLLSGNICRCTGYQGIVDAVMALAAGQRATLRLESTGTGALRPSPERPSLTSFPGNGGPLVPIRSSSCQEY